MPAIQELMPAQNFGGELGKILGGGISQGLNQQLQSFQKRQQNKSQIQSLMPLLEKFDINFSEDEKKQLTEGGFEPEMFLTAAMGLHKTRQTQQASDQKTFAKQQEFLQKQQAEEQEKNQEIQGFQNAFQTLEEMIPYTGTKVIPGFKSFTAGGLNREAVEKRENFDKLGFWLTDKVFTHFNKGTVSVPKFEEIKKNLAPRADLSERQNRARINALRTISNLPSNLSQKEFDKVANKEMSQVSKIPDKAPGDEEQIFANNPSTGERLVLKDGKWQPVQ